MAVRHSISQQHSFSALIILLILLFCSADSRAEVLFRHDYKSDEFMTGEEDCVVLAGYADHAYYYDKTTRYVGNWMKRFFGEVKEQRETTHFLLDAKEIREIDYVRGQILIFPIQKLGEMERFRRGVELQQQADEIIKERYAVKEPVFKLTFFPETETVQGYTCTRIQADLQMETVDVKKKSSSTTVIRQFLWVSTQVPGFDQYQTCLANMEKAMGLEAERMGPLGFLLQYWNGPLDPIRDQIVQVKGYPVKHTMTLDARHVSNIESNSPKTVEKRLKEESMILQEVVEGKLDLSKFLAPEGFGVRMVK